MANKNLLSMKNILTSIFQYERKDVYLYANAKIWFLYYVYFLNMRII